MQLFGGFLLYKICKVNFFTKFKSKQKIVENDVEKMFKQCFSAYLICGKLCGKC